ncbi:hypothetical protein RQP46_004064 [Phenoliferia psychrophenolica]
MDSKPDDVGAHLEHGLPGSPAPFTYQKGSKEERALLRKIDFRLLPTLWLMYVFNYLDRSNIGNAKAAGMAKELHLTSTDYSLALSIFFVGYLLNEVPSNMLLVRSRPSIFLPALMLGWGACSVGAKGINSLGGLIAFRFFLGIIEAGFFPGVMLLLSCWYRPEELSKRIALFYSASLVSGAVGGLLAGVITQYMDGVANVPSWKWLFVIEGCITVGIAVFAFFILPDYPSTTRWLTEDERNLAVARLARAEDQSEVKLTPKQAFVASVKDPKTWWFLMGYVLIAGSGTISYFFPTLMGSLGYTGRNVQYMTIPIYLVALVISLSMGYNADRTNSKPLHFVVACGWGAVAFIVCATVKKPEVRYAFICFGGAGIWSAVPLLLSNMVTQFEGREKRAISIALVNGFGNLASIYGSYIWPANTAPLYHIGFGTTTGLITLAGLCMVGIMYKFPKVPTEDDTSDESEVRDEKS